MGHEVCLSSFLIHQYYLTTLKTENSQYCLIIELILLMIMMERQRKEQQFRGDKEGFRVQFTLTNSEAVNVLLIQLTNIPRRTRYVLRINDNFIEQQEDSFKECVESVAQLYMLLVKSFEHLEITSDGCVILQVAIAQNMQAKKRSYRLEAIEQEINPSELYLIELEERVLKELSQIRSQFASRNLQLQNQSEGNQFQVESECCQTERKIIFKEYQVFKATNAIKMDEMRNEMNKLAAQIQTLQQINVEKEGQRIKIQQERLKKEYSREEHYIELIKKFELMKNINPEKNQTLLPTQFGTQLKEHNSYKEFDQRKQEIEQQLSYALQSLHSMEMELGDVKEQLSEVQHELEERSSQNEREIIKLNDVLQALVDQLERQRREETTELTPRDILRESPILSADQKNAVEQEPDIYQIRQWNSHAPYAYKFNINGGRAERIDYGMYQVTTQALSPKTTASIKLEYGGNRAIIVGIITQRRKEQRYSGGGQQETLAYVTYPNRCQGNIYMDNKVLVQLKDNLFIPNEGVLNIFVDLQQKTVTFSNISTERQQTIRLASCFWDKQLFFYATMFDKGSKAIFV